MNDRLVTSLIIETLERTGASEDESLYKAVKKIHNNIEKRFYENVLMNLELQGLIRVNKMRRDKRRVELVKG